jgi:tetratricopeptide (TPR) repeat protein
MIQKDISDAPFWPPIWKLLLIGIGSIVVVAGTVRMLRPQMDERLYARFRKLPQADVQSDTLRTWQVGAAHFNDKRYYEALESMQEVLQMYPSHGAARFFAGLCFLENNNMTAAEEHLGAVTTYSNTTWHTDAQYYTALAHLRRHDRAGCVELLQKIPGGHKRYADADSLTQKLR